MAERKESGKDTYHYAYDPMHAYATLQESTVLYYVNIVRRRAWTVIAVFVVASTIGIVNAYRAPRIYQAVAKMLVERQVPRVLKFDSVSQDYGGWDPEFYSTQVELARSRVVMEKTLEQKDIAALFQSAATPAAGHSSLFEEARRTVVALLGAMPGPPPEPWEILRGQVTVSMMRDTHFLQVRSQGVDPRRAAALVNAVAVAFEQYSVERKVEGFGEAFLFLDKEKKKQEQLLEQAEKESQEFRQSAKEVTLTGSEEDQPALRRLRELSEKLTQVQLDRIEYTAQMAVVHDVLNASNGVPRESDQRLFSLAAVRNDASVTDVQKRLVESRKEVDRLSDTYGPEHPQLKEARATVAVLERQFREVLTQLVLSLEGRLKVLQNQEDELQKEEESQKEHAVDLAKEVFTFTRLQNALTSHRKLYDALVERIREVDMSSGFIKTNVQVVEKASIPSAPVSPQRVRIVVVAMLLGLAAGVGLGFVFEHLDDTIKTPEDIKLRGVDLPLLGFIPRMTRRTAKEKKATSRTVGLVSVREPISSMAEAYRNIRTSILFSIPAGETKVLGLTSANPGEGKTTTACNLAIVMALSGKKVILIDADLHRPMVQHVFGLEGKEGLTNVLTGDVELAKVVQPFKFKTSVAGRLDILPAGPESPNPAELIGSQKMREVLAEVRQKYDWVFIDIPPVLFISDAGILSALSEGVILVVRAAINNRSTLMKTKERLDELKVHIVGCVLNDVILSKLGRYYSDYAYYGYSKYHSKYHKSYYSRDRGDKDKGGGKAGTKEKDGKKGLKAGSGDVKLPSASEQNPP